MSPSYDNFSDDAWARKIESLRQSGRIKLEQLPNKNLVLVTGAGAGFAGLQSYWVYRGWRRNEGSTVLMGIIGIALTICAVWIYLSLA